MSREVETFNVVARNHNDHVKNIAFLMNRSGNWSLAPAYDVTYSYDPQGAWTSQQQMSLNGKRDGFTQQDFVAVGRHVLPQARARERDSRRRDKCRRAMARVRRRRRRGPPDRVDSIAATHRLEWS